MTGCGRNASSVYHAYPVTRSWHDITREDGAGFSREGWDYIQNVHSSIRVASKNDVHVLYLDTYYLDKLIAPLFYFRLYFGLVSRAACGVVRCES